MRILDPQNCNHFPDFHDKLQLCVGKKMRNVYKVILLLVFFRKPLLGARGREGGRAEGCQLLSAVRDQGVSIHLLSSAQRIWGGVRKAW